MKFQSFEVIEKTIVRFESILEVDTTLDKFQRADIRDILDILEKLYESSKSPES